MSNKYVLRMRFKGCELHGYEQTLSTCLSTCQTSMFNDID